ncbi:Bug family tripartite tricarboxylate transporter substrate binding protein [Pseudokineococcus lusitanus]|uniref:Putative tricarboxylic transport membrane protein n=1 Tax=Pseudokineococcus lusitanus TaxID=763993 RepID=A0A3N1HQE4_9ACTN|nr:tripartite tricarboxylate transporter substrate-binding protein [Pseudokineococcus lusitanus]ROP44602.1 putative tricarboxylic transport membrane protein [Pseudokineococcus lusitanus]
MSSTTTTRRTPTRTARRTRAAVAAAVATAAVLAGCGTTGGTTGASAGGDGAAEEIRRLEIMAPADPGGGWDASARALSASMESEGLVGSTQVTNVGGAGGTVGLAELSGERSEDFLMVMGLVMVGAIETNASQATLADTTPIARLTAEDEVVVVPAASPYESIDDLIADMQARGGDVSIAGGSAGGTDHILAGLIAQAGDVPIEDLNYIPFSGGGESLAALIGNQVDAGISGIGEYAESIESGDLRPLAVSGAEPVEGIDAPTLTEAGYDVELSNWRGVVAPPGISDEARERLTALVEETHASEAWQAELTERGWEDTFLVGEEFDTFLAEEEVRVREVLTDLGLVQ